MFKVPHKLDFEHLVPIETEVVDGVTRMRLMTNNPARYGGLEGFGLEIAERVSLDISQARANG